MQTTVVGKWGRETEEGRWSIKGVFLSQLPPRELKLNPWYFQSGMLNRVISCACRNEEMKNWHLGVCRDTLNDTRDVKAGNGGGVGGSSTESIYCTVLSEV